MELNTTVMKEDAYTKYDRAKKKVRRLKGFYGHIKLFVLVNILILIVRFYILPKYGIVSDDKGFNEWLNWNTIIFPAMWAIAVLIHGLNVYNFRLFKTWEERKINELMEKDENESNLF